jgi:N-acetylmuramoyl-L-alanine amidase
MHEDRPSGTRIILTLLAWAVGLLVAFGVIFAIANALAPKAQPAPQPPVNQSIPSSTLTPTVAPSVTPASQVESSPPTAPAYAPPPAAAPKPAKTKPAAANSVSGQVVVIDAGHQAHGDPSLEPIGPGSSTKKAKVATGASGVATHNPESLINLRVALKLRDALRARGVTVVMVRTKQDVNVSNSARAALANRENADLFIRIHCDGTTNHSTVGLSTLVPMSSTWTRAIVAPSKKAASYVHRAVIAETHAHDRGIISRSDMSGFNWSKVPTVLVEMGFLSNPAEDRKLATAAYESLLANGLAKGISAYLATR